MGTQRENVLSNLLAAKVSEFFEIGEKGEDIGEGGIAWSVVEDHVE